MIQFLKYFTKILAPYFQAYKIKTLIMKTKSKKTHKEELSDLVDSPEDREKMKPEKAEINLPDATEIPGQEDIVPQPLGDLADVTPSSADEEGERVFNNNIDRTIKEDADTNVSRVEKETLHDAANDMPGDDENLRDAALDHTDDEGTPLNEGSFKADLSGSDLDVPGEELDDPNEEIGEEDEENNDYSIGGDTDDAPRDDF